jgi:hypothetical protein
VLFWQWCGLKFTGICQFGKLRKQETVGMAKKLKVGDPVMWYGSFVTYTVTAIDLSKKTADITNPRGETIGLHRDAPGRNCPF